MTINEARQRLFEAGWVFRAGITAIMTTALAAGLTMFGWILSTTITTRDAERDLSTSVTQLSKAIQGFSEASHEQRETMETLNIRLAGMDARILRMEQRVEDHINSDAHLVDHQSGP